MKRKKVIAKKFFPAMGLSLFMWFVFSKVALGDWSSGLADASGYGLPESSVYDIISNILDWILTIVGIVGVIGFAIAGIMYLTANGDDTKIKTAKNAMTASIIGVIVAICGVVVLYAVDNMLNATEF
jgi:cytochrome bd-type quinol oxidase subunit 2